MKRRGRLRLFVVVSWLFATPLAARLQADGVANAPIGPYTGNVENGRKLFERVWLTGDNPKKSDDGLGPMFNERSCVACHSQGGIGGGGPNEKNVDLLSVVVPAEWQWTTSEFQSVVERKLHHVGPGNPLLVNLERRVGLIHDDLRKGSMVLHSFGTDPRFTRSRERVLGLKPTPDAVRFPSASGPLPAPRRPPGSDPIKTIRLGDITLELSGRNSSAMFGSGLIDQLSETTLRRIADEQTKPTSKVSGRYVGRFGWRGQVRRLDAFVFGACDIELGLAVEEDPRVVAAPAAAAPQKPQGPPKVSKFDIGVADTDDLVAFVASLPTPRRRPPVDDGQAAAIKHGEQVFAAVGCADCHRPSIDTVEGLYSDLLVHDMGPQLADRSGPTPSVEQSIQPESIHVPGRTQITYYGHPRPPTTFEDLIDLATLDVPFVVSALGEKYGERLQEWKTPPLWGLADSAPYMHDGRAATVEDAIRWHGGEANESATSYRLLSQADREDMLTFLSTLIAPPGLKPTAP